MEDPDTRRFNIIDIILNEIQGQINREIQMEDTGELIVTPASNEFIDSLEEIEIVEEDKTCSICLEEFKIGDKCFKLPCKDHPHYFHNEKDNCMGIKKWLYKSNTCPICRTEFPKDTTGNLNEENGEPVGTEEDTIRQLDDNVRNLMRNILSSNIIILNPQEIIEMEEQRQLDVAVQASLEDQ